MIVKIKRASSDVPMPRYATAGAAGCDVTAQESVLVGAMATAVISTGLFLEVPEGYECQVRPRSGLAAKHGLTVLNSPGTLDSDYRGELKIILHNSSQKNYQVEKGDRIAQLVFAPVVQVQFEDVESLSETDRGERGFGSTGGK